MKKMFSPLFMTVAVMAAFSSCSKDNSVAEQKGTPISIMVGAPSIDTDSKVSTNGTELKHKWDAGDKITIFSYTRNATAAESIITNWGPFTTTNGGAYARFSGVIPAGFSTATHGERFIAFSQEGADFDMTWASASKCEVAFNIPAQQDGTGLKYCLFTTAAENGTQASFDGTDSFTGLYFKAATALNKINLTGGDVRTIRITVKHAIKDNFGLVSNGTQKDLKYNVATAGLSGGPVKTIVINNNDSVLSGDIYFVSRQTNGNATNGYVTLTFEFVNGNGQTCTRKKVLAASPVEAGTATSYYNLSPYNRLNNLGALDLTSATFE